jgi:hypothetical protein
MNDVSALSLAVLHRVAEFLDSVSEEHLADLAEGRARLTYIAWGTSEPVTPKAPRSTPARKATAPKVDSAAIVAQLSHASSRDEGRQVLKPLNITALRAVAKAAGMTGVSKTPMEDLVDQLVALTIGGRLSFAAMREL